MLGDTNGYRTGAKLWVLMVLWKVDCKMCAALKKDPLTTMAIIHIDA